MSSLLAPVPAIRYGGASRFKRGFGRRPRQETGPNMLHRLSEHDLNVPYTHWAEVSPWLGLTEADEQEIRARQSGLERERFSVLEKWKEGQKDKATYRFLMQAFFEAQRLDLVDAVITHVQTASQDTRPPHFVTMSTTFPPSLDAPLSIKPLSAPATTPHHSEPPTEPPPLVEYGYFLRELYTHEESTSAASAQWPPLPVRKAFNLAMIRFEGYVEELARLTITGKADDIVRRKVPVKLEDLHKLADGKQKLILVEGAPGSGKSALAWDICMSWGAGELFEEYDAIILVQLRDPNVQAASMLADILPAKDRAMAEHVAEEIMVCGGQKVLFIFDGWDELPSSLQTESFLSSLIRSEHLYEEALRSCTMIVTSRPISSDELDQPRCIELVGFTPSELKQYFSECLPNDSQAVEALLAKFEANPVIASSCYIPLNAAIIAHLYLSGNQTLPGTTHGVFTSLVLSCLSHYQEESLGLESESAVIDSLESLPKSVHVRFKRVCSLAFVGIMENKVSFTSTDLELRGMGTGATTLNLLQAVPSLVSQKSSTYYNFLHFSVQEFLAACHIASLPGSEQISLFQRFFEKPRFATVFQFYAGITKFESKRKYLSKVASLLPAHHIPTGIRDVIANMIRHGDKQVFLSLLHCLYTADDPSLCQFVALQLEEFEKQRVLELSPVKLRPLDCLALGYFMSCVTSTCSISIIVDIIDCAVGDHGCRLLMKGLSRNPVSKSGVGGKILLEMDINRIGDEGAQHIADVLRSNSNLRGLCITDNLINESSVKSIMNALSTNSSLVQLMLGHLQWTITEESGPVIREMLQRNNTLEWLTMRFMSNRGVSYIAEGLKQNSSLKKLDLPYCRVGDEGIARLGDALIENESLEVLDLSGSDRVSESGLWVLVECLKKNRGVVDLRLPSRSILEPTVVQEAINASREKKITVH